MHKPFEVTKNIYNVGVNDRTKHLFEGLWALPYGVSYNSYLVVDERIALIDTVDVCYSDVYFRKITSVLGEKPIDYLIVNHMEPDHSGAIEWLVTKYPNIQIVGNNRTAEMLKGYYNVSDNVKIIKDGDEVSLGTQTLQFHLTPMVHWPETMMTYISQSKTLFSGDAFGTFGTLDGGVTDAQLCVTRYWDEMTRYYAAIVGKFGSPVQSALKKLAGVEINTICSTHGPVWTEQENIEKVVGIYDKLSRYEADNGLIIAYGSMYGNTEQLAEIIAAEAASLGVKNIILHNVSKSELSEILRDIFKYKGLIIGSPTYNNKLYPGVENLVTALQNRGLKNRFFGYFGSFSWAGAAVKQLKEFSETMNFDIVGDPVEMKQSPNDEVAEKARELAKAMSEKLC
ncbi:MAG: FprA family A-type flavoprotein [Dysgonamonadaceae bacterium]|jgi:flavorubredoxin|nr:FprA family A-type flavoprotein [Dysgonamonadaceae bacterium]